VGGGALYVTANTDNIYGSTFSNNSASTFGGAINVVPDAVLVMTNSTLYRNTAGSGGGMSLQMYNSVVLSNDTLTENAATPSGGGIYALYTFTTISNDTIANNTAPVNKGGGIYFDKFGSLNLLSMISAQNSGGDIYYQIAGGSTISTIISYGHNLIGDGTGSIGLANGVNNDQVGTSAVPIDPKLANLTLNGGTTQTLALIVGSSAIGHGDCTGVASAIPSAPLVSR